MYPWIAENIFLRTGDLALGTRFVGDLTNWRELELKSREELANQQKVYLKNLLNHCLQKIPYYKDMGISFVDEPYVLLKRFPLIKKAEIKAQIHRFVDPQAHSLVVEKSSGSSGIQGEVYMTRKEQFSALATQTFMWEWSGYRLGSPFLQLGITPNRPFHKIVKDSVLKTIYQQAFDIDPNEVITTLRKIKSGKYFFGGYASGLYSYALLAEQAGLEDIRFKSVISWGDKMFDHYRTKIESTFGCQVFDTYGCTEGIMIAGQCEYGKYHILTPNLILELLDENGKEVEPGELGHVVVTRLDAYAMPLVRYYLGDLAIRENTEMTCACSRPFPILRRIVGRDTDLVKTRSGKILIVHFFTGIMEHIPEVRQFRIIQEELDSITFEYIPDALFTTDVLPKITKIIHEKLNEPMEIVFKEVNQIPNSPSGKPQIIVSKL